MTPLILNLVTRRRRMLTSRPGHLAPTERTRSPLNGRLGGNQCEYGHFGKEKMDGTYRDSNPGPSSPQPTDYATPPSPLKAFFLMCKEPLLNDVIIFLFPVGCLKHNCIFFSRYIRPSVQLSTRPSADPNIHPLSTPIPSVSASSRSTVIGSAYGGVADVLR